LRLGEIGNSLEMGKVVRTRHAREQFTTDFVLKSGEVEHVWDMENVGARI
jgi:hypothetical protein